jgi:hypothetical protein
VIIGNSCAHSPNSVSKPHSFLLSHDERMHGSDQTHEAALTQSLLMLFLYGHFSSKFQVGPDRHAVFGLTQRAAQPKGLVMTRLQRHQIQSPRT